MEDEEDEVDVINNSDEEDNYILPIVPESDGAVPEFFADILQAADMSDNKM